MKFFQRFSIVAVFCFVIVLGTNTVHADNINIGSISVTGNINSGTYSPNGDISVSGLISNGNPYSAIPAYLSASTNGVTKNVISQQTVAAGSSTALAQVTLKAPSTPGSYEVAFDAGANLPAATIEVTGYVYSEDLGSGVGCLPGGCTSGGSYIVKGGVCLQKRWEVGDPYPTPAFTLPSSISFNMQWKKNPYLFWSYGVVTIPAGQTCGDYAETTTTGYTGLFAPQPENFCMSTSSGAVEIPADIQC